MGKAPQRPVAPKKKVNSNGFNRRSRIDVPWPENIINTGQGIWDKAGVDAYKKNL